jgi:alkylation response protein AidB-like acyl-CoA dehydrogenase
MDVRLSAEQRALRDAAAQLVERLGPHSVLDLADHERASKLDAALVASGWRELREADDDGAPWASAVEVAVVAEELGRGLADTAFLGPTLSAELRRLSGLPPAGTPETVVFRGDLSAPIGLASGVTIDAGAAVDAAGAAVALVVLGASGSQTLGSLRLQATEGEQVDLTRLVVQVAGGMPAMAVPEQVRALTADDVTRWTALGLALTCADLVGVMTGTIKLASDYAGVRRQYGSPIGSFQAVQHLLADAFVSMEGSRSIARHAAWAVDALPAADALAAAASAKAYCARAARAVCEASIQVHGGIGNTWECLAHVYLRRALVSSDLFGNVGVNLSRVLDHHQKGTADGLR